MKKVIAFNGVSLREVRFNGILLCNFNQHCFLTDGDVYSFKVRTFAEVFEYMGDFYLHTFISSHKLRVYSDFDSARNAFVEFVSLV